MQEAIPNTTIRNGVYYGVVQVDGHEVRKSLRTRDPIVASEKVRRWLAQVSPSHSAEALTFAEVASSWIEAYQTQYTKKTWKRYRTSLKMMKPFFGSVLWEDVTRSALVDFMAQRRQTATVSTVNRDLAVISNIFEHAIDQGWCDDNPVRRLSRKARRERRLPFTLPTDEMIEAPFARMHGTFGELCRLALLTGMRRDELVHLRWQDVDLDRRTITLFRTKNHRVRVVALAPEAVFLLDRRNNREGHVFVNSRDALYNNASEMWRDVMVRAGKHWSDQYPDHPFIRFRFHDLRHIFAIRYLKNGGNLYVLQKLLGHSTILQTEEYLQYLTPDEQALAKGV